MIRCGVLAALALVGCGLPEPDPAELYGTWTNEEDGFTRALVFAETGDAPDMAGETNVYWSYLYAVGSEPVETHHGYYEIAGPQLVMTATSFGNDDTVYVDTIVKFGADRMVLGVDDNTSGEREYTPASDLP